MLESTQLPEAIAHNTETDVDIDSWSIGLESQGSWEGRRGSTRQS